LKRENPDAELIRSLETQIQARLVSINSNLLKDAANEPRIAGRFPSNSYSVISQLLQRLLDALVAARMALTTDYGPSQKDGRREIRQRRSVWLSAGGELGDDLSPDDDASAEENSDEEGPSDETSKGGDTSPREAGVTLAKHPSSSSARRTARANSRRSREDVLALRRAFRHLASDHLMTLHALHGSLYSKQPLPSLLPRLGASHARLEHSVIRCGARTRRRRRLLGFLASSREIKIIMDSLVSCIRELFGEDSPGLRRMFVASEHDENEAFA
jgi:hypothetical protein